MLNRKLIALILSFFAAGCDFGSGFGPEYGVSEIKSPGGETLYFRREVKGRNYDALSLSKDPDYCSEPDPNEALIFRGMGPITIYYEFKGEELHLYSAGETNKPRNFSERVKLVVHDISNPEYIELNDNYRERGLEKLDVPINKSLPCVF